MKYPFSLQFQQFVTLLILFVFGKSFANIHLGWIEAVMILLFAGVVEHLFLYLRHGVMEYWSYSALSTAIGVMLMVATPHSWIYGVMIVLGLAQKHFLRVRGHHFFNPSNFALMIGMVLFYDQAHIVLGQLGDASWLRGVVILLAALILVRVDRWRIAVVFVISYLACEYLWVVGYDPVVTFRDVYERFYYVSFVIFVAFMLTDPRTTPSRGWHQVVFGVVLAVLASWMDRLYGIRAQHLFMVLFLLSPMVPLIEHRGGKIGWMSITLTLLALGVIIYLEYQPPYHFEMEG